MHITQLVLASQSEIRRKILESSGLGFVCMTSSVDEKLISFKDPRQLAFERAKAKSLSVASQVSNSLILGCDQTLSCEGQKFSKPKSKEEALKQLQFLSGKIHFLHSAVFLSISCEGKIIPLRRFSFVKDCKLEMRKLSQDELSQYLELNQWKSSVGGYKIEGSGIHLFEENSSEDYMSIMGLPLLSLLSKLRSLGLNFISHPKGPWKLVHLKDVDYSL